jgi:hypothetical protein
MKIPWSNSQSLDLFYGTRKQRKIPRSTDNTKHHQSSRGCQAVFLMLSEVLVFGLVSTSEHDVVPMMNG